MKVSAMICSQGSVRASAWEGGDVMREQVPLHPGAPPGSSDQGV